MKGINFSKIDADVRNGIEQMTEKMSEMLEGVMQKILK
jgi:hypothetical protein